jgi:hypothetical protein
LKKKIDFETGIKIFIPILLSLLIVSCSENPSITGYGLLNPADSLLVQRFDSNRDSVFVYHKQINQSDILGGTRRILVGKYEDLTAHSLIRFLIGLSDELKGAVKNSNVVIQSARVKLNPVYKFGDTTSNRFSFLVKEIKSNWGEYTFTIDSLKSGKYEISNENIAIRNIDDDTLYYCELNPNAVLNWFKSIANDSTKPQGILLSPDPSTTFIKGFASSTAYYVGDPIVLEVVAEYNSKIDSLKFFVDADLHVVETSNTILTDDAKIILQSGVKTKSFICFDLSKVPTDAVVNSAFIRLYPDTSNSLFGTSFQDSLIVQFVSDSSKIAIDSAVVFYMTKKDSSYYEGQINYYVQKWIDNNSNLGLLISTKDPEGGVEKFVFYGPKSALIEKRPQLIINYSRLK